MTTLAAPESGKKTAFCVTACARWLVSSVPSCAAGRGTSQCVGEGGVADGHPRRRTLMPRGPRGCRPVSPLPVGTDRGSEPPWVITVPLLKEQTFSPGSRVGTGHRCLHGREVPPEGVAAPLAESSVFGQVGRGEGQRRAGGAAGRREDAGSGSGREGSMPAGSGESLHNPGLRWRGSFVGRRGRAWPRR